MTTAAVQAKSAHSFPALSPVSLFSVICFPPRVQFCLSLSFSCVYYYQSDVVRVTAGVADTGVRVQQPAVHDAVRC